MKFTGERFVPDIEERELSMEHFQRYYFAKQIANGKIILDAACGEGYGSNILVGEAQKVYGIDISKEAIQHAKNKYNSNKIEFINSSIENLPFDDDTFDVVVSFETIEHVNHDIQVKFLKEVSRVLKKDGIFLISTPNKKIYSDIPNYKNEFHVKEFYKEEYVELLKEYFKEIKLYSQYFEITSNIENINSNIAIKKSNYLEDNAKYFIAVCSNQELKVNINSSIYIDEHNKYNKIVSRVLELQNEIIEKNNHITNLNTEIDVFGKEIKRLNEHIEDISSWGKKLNKDVEQYKKELENYSMKYKQNEVIIETIYQSNGWKLLAKCYRVRDCIFPKNSKRRFLMKLIKKAIKNPKVYINSLNKENLKKLKYYMKNEDLIRIEDRLNCFDEKHTEVEVDEVKIIEVEDGIYENIKFESADSPMVSIIIPVYNQWNYTYSCLKSIKENTDGISYEIIIADDVSSDLTKDINLYIENINVIRNEENLGFLLNCNNAAKHAKGKYIHFLNNDTNVQKNWLSSLLELIENDENIGMVGSKLVYSNGKLQEAGGIIWNDASGWNYGRLDDPSKSEYNYVKEVDYISGASIMIKTSLWKKIGGFDERYVPAYFEDSDLAFEVRKAGYKVMYQPKSVVVHFEGISHGTDENTGIKSYQLKNKEKFISKWKDILEKNYFNNAEHVFLARDKSRHKETIVVIDHYVPHYDRDAGSRTTYQYLNLLVDMGFNVKFIGDNFFKHEPYTTKLQENGIEVLYGEYYQKHWDKWIKQNNEYIDYVFLHRPHITEKYIDFMKKNTKAKIIYYVHDIHYLRELREYNLTYNEETLKISNEWKKKEIDIMRKSDVVMTPSVDEKIIISKEIGQGKTFASPIFYYKKFNELDVDVEDKKDLLFVGGFGHKPNEDGVIWFINKVWPLVLEKLPDINFKIVGSNPTEKIKSLASKNIIVTGFVSDEELLEYYKKSRISIIPLRYGAGVKGKTIEAMYNKSAIVSTNIGIEGLEGINDYIMGYDTPEEFANEIISLYEDEERLKYMPNRYNEYLKKYFSHDGAKKLFKTIFTK